MKPTFRARIVVSLVAVSAAALPALALSPSDAQAMTRKIIQTKAVEVPAKAAALVSKASKEDKEAVATTVVRAAARSHPSTIGSVVTSVLHKSPDLAVSVVNSAVDELPGSSLTIVTAAIEAAPSHADKVVSAAGKKQPAQASVFEREAAASRSRRLVAAANGQTGGVITQTPRPPGDPPVNVYAQPGLDPNRP
jgi:hypothetical protein